MDLRLVLSGYGDLNWIFDATNINVSGIQLLQGTIKRDRFAAAGRASYQHQSLWLLQGMSKVRQL